MYSTLCISPMKQVICELMQFPGLVICGVRQLLEAIARAAVFLATELSGQLTLVGLTIVLTRMGIPDSVIVAILLTAILAIVGGVAVSQRKKQHSARRQSVK